MRKPTCVYVPFFNEAGPHLERQLESFLNWGVKKIYYVDGPFPTFPHDTDKSTDGSRELILSYPNTTIIEDHNMIPVEGIKIHCDDLARPRERDNLMTKYQDSNSTREREIMYKKYIWQICDMDFPPTLSKSGSRYYTCGCIIRVDGVR